MSHVVKHTMVKVKPVMSSSMPEAKRRVLNLYKAWYRAIPAILSKYDMPVSPKDCKLKLREMFDAKKDVRDIRTIDVLVIKGQLELVETLKMFKSACHVMAFFKDSQVEKPKDFLSNFLDGH